MKTTLLNVYQYLATHHICTFESIVQYYVFAYVYLNNIGLLSVVVGQFN